MNDLKTKLQESFSDARERLVDMTIRKHLTTQLKNDYPDSYEVKAFNLACNELLDSRHFWFGWTEVEFSQRFGLCRGDDDLWTWLDTETHIPVDAEDDE
jgi:hypothetical protein